MRAQDARNEAAHDDFLHSAECLHVDITWLTDTTFSAGVMLSMTTGMGPDDEDTHEVEYEAVGTLIRGVLEIDALPRIADEVRAAVIEGMIGGEE